MQGENDVIKKELQTLLAIIFFLTLALVGLKIYESKTGLLVQLGSKVFDQFISK